jgi:hypothetical protein
VQRNSTNDLSQISCLRFQTGISLSYLTILINFLGTIPQKSTELGTPKYEEYKKNPVMVEVPFVIHASRDWMIEGRKRR